MVFHRLPHHSFNLAISDVFGCLVINDSVQECVQHNAIPRVHQRIRTNVPDEGVMLVSYACAPHRSLAPVSAMGKLMRQSP